MSGTLDRIDLCACGVFEIGRPRETPSRGFCGQVQHHLFRGASPLNEVVFFHPTTRTLILTDLAFNISMETARKSPLFYMLWDVGHFGPHRFVRLRGIRDWEAARNSVERILRTGPASSVSRGVTAK